MFYIYTDTDTDSSQLAIPNNCNYYDPILTDSNNQHMFGLLKLTNDYHKASIMINKPSGHIYTLSDVFNNENKLISRSTGKF